MQAIEVDRFSNGKYPVHHVMMDGQHWATVHAAGHPCFVEIFFQDRDGIDLEDLEWLVNFAILGHPGKPDDINLYLDRYAEVLGCDPRPAAIAGEITRLKMEIDQARRTVAELRKQLSRQSRTRQ